MIHQALMRALRLLITACDDSLRARRASTNPIELASNSTTNKPPKTASKMPVSVSSERKSIEREIMIGHSGQELKDGRGNGSKRLGDLHRAANELLRRKSGCIAKAQG